MAAFVWNKYLDENIFSQYRRYLQNQYYVDDINGVLIQNKNDLQSSIKTASTEQQKAIQQVCGKLDEGFELISSHLIDIKFELGQIRGEINAMSAMLDWRLSQMVEEQRLTNQLLGHIVQLLRLPESQKEKGYYIEEALKYLKNAIKEGFQSEFYVDAFENLKEAEKRGKKDYITLNKIGFIHLNADKFLDIALAKEYYLKSARESYVEANAGGTTASNNAINNSFMATTAESYLYASRACYLQQDINEAIQLADKAYSLVPELLEAGFSKAKYLAVDDKAEQAANILEKIIEKDRLYSIKTLEDKDLADKKEVLHLLETLQKRALSTAKEGLKKCPDTVNLESEALPIVEEIKRNIKKGSFLSAMKAIDIINSDNVFQYIEEVEHRYDGKFRVQRRANNLKINEFIKKENDGLNELELKKKKIRSDLVRINTSRFCFLGAALGFVIGFFRGCSLSQGSVDSATFGTTIIGLAILGALIGFVAGNSVTIKEE